MKLRLLNTIDNERKYEKNRNHKPVDVFHSCPYCESAQLIKFEEEVICQSCDWNSIATHIEALDHVMSTLDLDQIDPQVTPLSTKRKRASNE